MNDDVAIKVENLSKSFRLPHERHTSIKHLLFSILKGGRRTYEKQQVLKDISFEIKKGEFFGIVGRNGSGKSTLLKLLAGVYSPSSGNIGINGKLTPFIELGVGFNPELTGRENVFLNGSLLGFSRKEIEKMYDDIVEFAELEKFMDQKLKNYSSGMQVRLAFSIAIKSKNDILVFDEVLAVGDISFQQKCYQVFDDLKKSGMTIVLVTHDMSAVLRFCSRAMIIDKGKIIKSSEPSNITDLYMEVNYDNTQKAMKTADEKIKTKDFNIDNVSISNITQKTEKKFITNDELEIAVEYSNDRKKSFHIGVQIYSDTGAYVFGTNTKIAGFDAINKPQGKIKIKFNASLNQGSYYLTFAATSESLSEIFDYKPKISSFRITNPDGVQGIASLNYKWEI